MYSTSATSDIINFYDASALTKENEHSLKFQELYLQQFK